MTWYLLLSALSKPLAGFKTAARVGVKTFYDEKYMFCRKILSKNNKFLSKNLVVSKIMRTFAASKL
jgi:hypothetical protein